MGETPPQRVHILGCIQTEKSIEPLFNWVARTIPNWLFKGYFGESSASPRRTIFLDLLLLLIHNTLLILLTQRLEQLEGQTSARALITVHCGGKYDHVGAEQLFDKGDRNSGRFVHNQQLSLGKGSLILRSHILNRLSVISENVYSNHSVVEVGVRALQNVIILMFFVIQSVKTFKYEFKHGGKVFRGWSCHKNVRKSIHDRRSNTDTQSSRFSSTSTSGETHGTFKGLFRNFVDNLHYSRRLIVSFAQRYQISNRFGVFEGRLQVFELLFFVCEIQVARSDRSISFIFVVFV